MQSNSTSSNTSPYSTPSSTLRSSHGSSAADVDCDGDIIEVNASSAAPNQLSLNSGSGQFTAAPPTALGIAGGSGGQRWQEASFVDFDADGDQDLYLGARCLLS